METNKEEAIGEVKAPISSADTVEAAKQLLTDVLEKAVDAIKETSLSAVSEADVAKTAGKFADEENRIDYVVKGKYNGEAVLLAEGKTFTTNIVSAKGFSSEKLAQEFLKEAAASLPLEGEEILMRTIKCYLNEIGHGE